MVGDPASVVNPFMGTVGNPDQPWGGQGNTYPGAQSPFGMLAWGPDTPSRPSGGGYSDQDSAITGFSLTHVNGPGCDGLAGDVPFLPVSGDLPDGSKIGTVAEPFDHSSQSSTPGSYAVTAGGVQTKLATTQRAGIASFTYPAGKAARLLLKTGGGSALGELASNVTIVGNDEITGMVEPGKFCGGSPTYQLFFSVVFDQPFASVGTWTGTTESDGSTSATGTQAGAYVSFNPDSSGTVLAKVGISYVDLDGAAGNRTTEIPGWDLPAVQKVAHDDWNGYLDRVQIGGGTADQQAVFYTSLYRAFESPNVFNDADGRYLGFDEKVHSVDPGRNFYTTFSGWDTYRTEQPLLAWLAPDVASDMMQSMVEAGEQSPTHSLPHWTVANHDGFVMPGDPSGPIIATSYALGARNFDASKALDLLIAQSKGQHTYTATTDASTVLEYAESDYASAQLATELGRTSDATALINTAAQWVDKLDPATGFLRPTTADGFFAKTFDPTGSIGMVEGTAAQYRFSAPSTFPAMINAAGGDQATVKALDTFFTNVNGGLGTPYAWMGNEPGLASPYAYLQAGAPTHTEAVLSRIRSQLYTNTPNGIVGGNDDLGSMSSWYVFAALGVSPAGPGLGSLLLSNPLFPYESVQRAGGNMTISAPDTAATGSYIQSMTVNGTPNDKSYLPQSTVLGGAQIDIKMGSDAGSIWGTTSQDIPPVDDGGIPSVDAGVSPTSDTATLNPGKTEGYTLTVGDIAGKQQDVSWTAKTPDGLTLTPSSGSMTVEAHSTSAVALTASSTSGAGAFPVTLTVTGADGSTFTRSLNFQVARVGGVPNGLVDDFEGYPNDASLQAAYAFNHASADQITLDKSAASQGTYGLRFAYDFSGDTYSGFGKTFTPAQDWSGFAEVDAHLVPDGSNQQLVFQFTAGGATFEAYPSLAGTDAEDLTVLFSSFKDKAGTHAAPTAAQLKSVSDFWVYINKTASYTKPGSIGLDDIHAARAAAPVVPSDPNAGALVSLLDSTAVSRDADPGEANLAGGNASYSSEALAASGLVEGQAFKTADGVVMTWPKADPGTPDSVKVNGQTVKISSAKGASTLGILGTSIYACNGSSGAATVTYTDGTTDDVTLSFGDWTRCGGGAAILPGNTVIASTNYRNTTTTTGDPVATFLYEDSIAVDPSKQVAGVMLPSTISNGGQIYVFAIGTNAAPVAPPSGPTVIAVPAAPVWTDACGPDDNGSFSGYANTDEYTWTVTDHSKLNGKVGITVTAKAGFAFATGARTRWTQKQNNSRCDAAITATTSAQTCTATGAPIPGSLTLATTGIGTAYVYVGTVTGTKASKLTSLPAGQYLIIATAKDGYAFNQVPTGWKASPSKDADGNVVKVSRVVEVGATDCEAAAISVTTTAQTCSATGTSVPGSLTLDKLNIGSAYVYVGRKTGTKAPDLSSMAPGDYLVIASASSGHWFHSVPPGWKASPTKDAAGHTVKLSTIVTVNPTTCGT